MRRTGAAEGDEREGARIDPLLDRHDADRIRHVLVADAHHGRGRLDPVEAELRAQRVEHGAGAPGIERELASEEEGGIEAAEHHVGVGDRGALAALAVAGRAGHRARALRAHLEEAAGVDPADRASARADRARRHAGHAHGQAELDLEVRGVERLSVDDQADVAARAAHVERDRLGRPGGARRVGAADRAARDAREQQVRRACTRLARERMTAVRLQQRPAPPVPVSSSASETPST